MPATVLGAEDSRVNPVDKIPALLELILWGKIENKQCMMVISTTEKN